MLDIEFVFGNDTAIGSTGHGRKHGGKTRVPAKDFDNPETLVGAGGRAQAVDHLNGTRDAGTEADAIVGAGDIVVHCLRDARDFEAFRVETTPIAKRVVSSYAD